MSRKVFIDKLTRQGVFVNETKVVFIYEKGSLYNELTRQ